jgi:hypothetical protein
MIWYRHWLEIRSRVWIGMALALAFGLLYPIALHGEFGWFYQTGRIFRMPQGWVVISDFVGHLKPELLIPWGIHTWFATWVAWVAQLFFVGDGIHAQFSGVLTSGVTLTSVTLAFPLSRRRMVWTRLVAGFGGVAAILMTALLFEFVVLLVTGRPVPWQAMLASSLLAAVATLPGQAVLSVIVLVGDIGVASLLSFVAAFLSIPLLEVAVWPVSSGMPFPWARMTWILLTLLFFAGLSMVVATNREFER